MTISSTHPAALPHLLGQMQEDGIPLTKAGYLWAFYAPEIPDLPVSDEIAAHIPETLPGTLPRTYRELLDALKT